MKFCENCGEEIFTRDGENRCQKCQDIEDASSAKKRRVKNARKAREQAMRDCGLVKVRGALGGVYRE